MRTRHCPESEQIVEMSMEVNLSLLLKLVDDGRHGKRKTKDACQRTHCTEQQFTNVVVLDAAFWTALRSREQRMTSTNVAQTLCKLLVVTYHNAGWYTLEHWPKLVNYVD